MVQKVAVDLISAARSRVVREARMSVSIDAFGKFVVPDVKYTLNASLVVTRLPTQRRTTSIYDRFTVGG